MKIIPEFSNSRILKLSDIRPHLEQEPFHFFQFFDRFEFLFRLFIVLQEILGAFDGVFALAEEVVY